MIVVDDLWGTPVVTWTAPPVPVWPIALGGVSVGIGPIRRLYADYYTDRQTRFYYRGLSRDGVYFADAPALLVGVNGCCDADIW